MATQVQNRRGSTAEHSTFTGAVGEVTVDTDKEVVVVHDGTTAGGYPQMRENGSNSALALGSAATPSLKFTGDTNTGIYSPGADQVAISTGSSERIRIGANGEIGLAGANYGTNGQVLTSAGSGAAPTWQTLSVSANSITQGNTSAEVIDTGSDGRFVVTTEGSERARVDSSGRLLVGTSSARSNYLNNSIYSGLLQVEGTTDASRVISFVHNTADGAQPIIVLGKTRGSAAGSNTVVQDADGLGTISFQGSDGTELVEGARIQCNVDGTPGANDMPGRLVFSTTADGASSPTERMRIASNGAILFNATTDSQTTDTGVKFLGAGASEGYISQVFSTTNGGDTTLIAYSTGDGTYKYYFRGNGGLANYQANNINLSDEREKKNIENLDSTWDCLKHWELKKFHYNTDSDNESKRYGVIAQQIEPHCPEVITDWKKTEDEDGNPVMRLGVKEQQMYWMAIKALQEAQVRIEALEAEVAALKAQ